MLSHSLLSGELPCKDANMLRVAPSPVLAVGTTFSFTLLNSITVFLATLRHASCIAKVNVGNSSGNNCPDTRFNINDKETDKFSSQIALHNVCH